MKIRDTLHSVAVSPKRLSEKTFRCLDGIVNEIDVSLHTNPLRTIAGTDRETVYPNTLRERERERRRRRRRRTSQIKTHRHSFSFLSARV